MMALKDWKKTINELSRFNNTRYIVWEKDNDRISYWELTAGKTFKKKVKKVYQVNPKNKKAKMFESKVQALKFAKTYMKKH